MNGRQRAPGWLRTPQPEAVAGYGELVRGAMGEPLRAVELVLPWPPSTNHYWRSTTAGVLISRQGRAYRNTVAGLVMAQRPRRFANEARLAVHIDAHPPDRRRRDLDNTLKALLDALQHGGLYADDSAIDDLRIRRLGRREGGEVLVRVAVVS